MPQLGRFDYTVQDPSGNAISGASVAIYREGASVNGNQSGTSPLAVTVHHAGKIATGDSVFVNATTGTVYTATRTSSTVLTLTGFGGTLALSTGDRITASNAQPTLYGDDYANATTTNPLTTSATGRAECWMEYGAYDLVVSGGGGSTRHFTSQVMPTEHPGQIRYMSSFAAKSVTGGLQEAINDLPTSGGTVLLDAPVTPQAVITVTGNDVTLQGQGIRSQITKGINGNILFVTGQRFKGLDLDVTGVKATYTGSGIVLSGSADSVIQRCRISSNASYGILVDASSARCKILDNTVALNDDAGIFAQNGATDCTIRGNYSDSTGAAIAGAHAIVAHSSGGDVSGLVIADNRCISGGSASFCIEVGQFLGGTAPSNVSITGNVCTSAANGAGGISLSSCNDSVLSGNTYNANGKTLTISGIEITLCDSVSCVGNHIIGSTGTPSGIVLSTGSKRCSVVGNTINGFGTTAAINVGIWINSSTAGVNTDRNVVSANTINFSAAGAGTGIRVQANSVGGTCDGNAITSNVINGVGAANSIGIVVNGTNGTLSDCLVVNNMIHNVATGISTNAATVITQKARYHNNYMSPSVTVKWSADSIQAITADATTLWAGTNYLQVTSNAAPRTLTSTPTLADSFDGDIVTIVNVDSAADTVVLQDQGTLPGSNLRLSAATITLAARDSIILSYNATVGDWIQIGQTNVT